MKSLSFEKAFKYPFNRMKGLMNAFWIFLPIFGWLALIGYTVRIVNEFLEGKFEHLPTMQFIDDMKLGFMMFVKALPFVITYMVFIAFTAGINENLSEIV
ncbi:MAG: hypothetical protein U9O53_03265, partial [archaeon]|nr:hypothetical protein [archaeon]